MIPSPLNSPFNLHKMDSSSAARWSPPPRLPVKLDHWNSRRAIQPFLPQKVTIPTPPILREVKKLGFSSGKFKAI